MRRMAYNLWAHKTSGEIYAVETDAEGRVVGACGPLHHSEARSSLLADMHYRDDADLIADVDAHADDYRLFRPVEA